MQTYQTKIQNGLSDQQVTEARNRFGKNQVEGKKRDGIFGTIIDLIKEPMLILLVVAAGIYFITGSQGEGIFMLGAIVLISAISIFQENKSRNALAELKTLTQPKCQVIRNSVLVEILLDDLVVGDVLVLEEGDKIPADGIILESHDFSVNESILTGESLSLPKSENDEDNNIYQGTLVASGRAVCEVTQTGSKTRLAEIGESLDSIDLEKSPLQIQISSFVKNMAIVGAGVFLIVLGINFYHSGNFVDSLLKALTLAMSILPEEIPVAFTTFMALGAWRLMKMGIIVKRTQTIETLGSATVICSDKTGTITQNNMSLASLYVAVNDKIVEPDTNISDEAKKLLSFAMWSSEPVPFDPMEKALHQAYAKFSTLDERTEFELIHEYPLEGKPPMMTHVFASKTERIIAAKGAPEAIMSVSTITESEKNLVQKAVDAFTKDGYRVLGVAESMFSNETFPDKQQQLPFNFLGLAAFYDPPKSNIKSVLESFYRAGINVKIITGDNASTTQNIAKQVGFKGSDQVLNGEDLVKLDQKTLQEKVSQVQIFARMFPEAKLRVIKALKANGEIVAMIGDGVNDGPALKAAHIGVAMGKKGTEIAKQASSLILADDDLALMIDAVAMGRKIYTNLKNAIRYILSIHIPIILTVFIPLVLGWKYPNIFTPVHIIFFELIMGPTCSIIYENEPVQSSLLLQKPRPFTSSFFSINELSISILQGLAITAGMLFIYQYGIIHSYDEPLIRAMVFIGLLSANVSLTLINRSFHDLLIATLAYKNNLVLLIISITVLLSALIFLIPQAAYFFRLETPDLNQLVFSVLVGIGSTIWFEVVKYYNNRQ
ncbi:cation-translocating P-type ATPase [Dyadobacter psychrotolerans]|uniref:Cation-translocating P-type ATPase n=1 Tax=Dyadobacter psychrotolerans TaxID=2541721 RepID=A0A4R5E0H1_9BACT|nr:cation-translocating P-type ATPase [Dyadobacter psychrotolerans]TDE18001.1 cation-translocating P-type ATPase [Dyadobacter psychrotolerans]